MKSKIGEIKDAEFHVFTTSKDGFEVWLLKICYFR